MSLEYRASEEPGTPILVVVVEPGWFIEDDRLSISSVDFDEEPIKELNASFRWLLKNSIILCFYQPQY